MRELENCLERAVILAEGSTIEPAHLNLPTTPLQVRADAPADPWDQIDLSGTLDDATRRVVLEVEKRKIAAALQESGDDALRGRRAPRHGAAPAGEEDPLAGAHALVPSDLSARVSAAPVTSVTTRVRPMPVGSTKCSVPASTFLSRAVAATHAAADRSAIGGRGPTPIDQRRDAVGLGRGHRARGRGPRPPPPASPSRPPRRA